MRFPRSFEGRQESIFFLKGEVRSHGFVAHLKAGSRGRVANSSSLGWAFVGRIMSTSAIGAIDGSRRILDNQLQGYASDAKLNRFPGAIIGFREIREVTHASKRCPLCGRIALCGKA